MLTWQKKNGEWGLNGVPEEELKKLYDSLNLAMTFKSLKVIARFKAL